MSRKIEILIPVKPCVKKFIEAKYYNEPDGFIMPRRDEPLGDLLESHLEKNFLSTVEQPPKGTILKVRLYCDSKLMHVPKEKLPFLSRSLNHSFRESLVMYAIAYYNERYQYQPGVEKFLNMFGICDEELSVNTAVRIVRLWEEKMARNQKKFRAESVAMTASA